ncbi:DMT family transporter [Pseudolysinimonas yzui]|uniref:Permease n=1 Tax=Pseudolysinimonas yzui TaxID=2708254 RepID=A0A8J3LYX7_9MICO|nr:EamA family transporter [Pseudolysinimonas yzui]GHF08117.1 permease [Pseudolysinimonas yzui]
MTGARNSGFSAAGVVALVLACLLWGTTGTTATLMPDDVSPLAIGAATMGIGGVLLLVTAPRMSRGVLRDPVGRRWATIGAIGVAVYPLAFYTGMDLVGVAVGNVVALGSGPVFAALIEWLIERQRLSTRWLVSTALAVIGITLLALGRQEGGAAGGSAAVAALGVGLGLLAGFAYALYTYASSRAIRAGHPSRGVMGGMFGLGAVPLLLVLLVVGGPLLQSWTSVGLVGYLVLGPMFVAYLLFGIGLRSVRSSTATTITLLEPVFATVLAVLVVGERLSVVGWAGFALVLIGLAVLVSARRGARAIPPA